MWICSILTFLTVISNVSFLEYSHVLYGIYLPCGLVVILYVLFSFVNFYVFIYAVYNFIASMYLPFLGYNKVSINQSINEPINQSFSDLSQCKVHALVTGPFDTPYEGGFFHFMIRFPPDYPHKPPRVKLLTTGHNSVRFNPNFYHSGKVCLSILG